MTYLEDKKKHLQISKTHLQIISKNGTYQLIDTESSCGTIINNIKVGGNYNGGTSLLHDNDIITIGDKHSPYKFKFIVLHNDIPFA